MTPHWRQVTEGHTCRLETYGLNEGCDIRATDLKLTNVNGKLGVAFHVSCGGDGAASGRPMDFDAQIDMPGRFSVYNALTAIAICRHFDVSVPDIQRALLAAKVKGTH